MKRATAIKKLIERKAKAAGCNNTDTAIGQFSGLFWYRRGHSGFRAIQSGISAAHAAMDRRVKHCGQQH